METFTNATSNANRASAQQWPNKLPPTPEKRLRVRDVGAIALEYFANVSEKHAKRKLREEINSYPALREALEQTGWSSYKRYFTPLQQRILIKYLG